jgi:hypothetical protein
MAARSTHHLVTLWHRFQVWRLNRIYGRNYRPPGLGKYRNRKKEKDHG